MQGPLGESSTSLGIDYASILLPMEAFPTAGEVVHSQEGEVLRPQEVAVPLEQNWNVAPAVVSVLE